MIKIGFPAPDWNGAVAYQKGKFIKLSLADYKGKWLALFFYPRDFTYICPTELRAFAAQKADFGKLKAEIVACSTDSEWSHKAWMEHDLPQVDYPVIADTTHQIAARYDVLNEESGAAERGTFLIDPEGIVRYIVVSSEQVGRSVKETLRVLQALETEERCPAEWHPGEPTLGKPDQNKKS
ncbi:peroxiredoxin [Candidatus Uhrbacteria bacterium]|nr:peroxiredoxin [Candidatus Uhrbacteria bacterium]